MEELKPFRKQIDALDNEIIALFGKRFEIIREVAQLKSQKGIPAVLPDRIDEVRDRCVKMGEEVHLDPEFIYQLYTLIIDHACNLEENTKEYLQSREDVSQNGTS